MSARPITIGLVRLSVLGAALLLPSCIPVENPLSDPEKSQPDARLFGAWKGRNKEANDPGITVLLIGKSGVEGAPPGIMKWLANEVDKDNNIRTEKVWYFFPTSLGNNHYLHVFNPVGLGLAKDQPPAWQNRQIKGYSLFKYTVEGDKFTLWFGDSKAVNTAIRKRQVKGTIDTSRTPTETLTGGEDLAKFLAKAGDTLFFPAKEESQIVFTRIK